MDNPERVSAFGFDYSARCIHKTKGLQMIWGIGTGRCGTKSLAKLGGGVHEPKPWFLEGPAEYARGLRGDGSELLGRLEERRDMDVPIVVDSRQSYMIDLISTVDPDAAFVWLVRDPFSCIASFIAGGAFTETDFYGARKMQPEDGWAKSWYFAPGRGGDIDERIRRTAYHWAKTNIHILTSAELYVRTPLVIVFTHHLSVRENHYSKSESIVFTREQAQMVMDNTGPIWALISIFDPGSRYMHVDEWELRQPLWFEPIHIALEIIYSEYTKRPPGDPDFAEI